MFVLGQYSYTLSLHGIRLTKRRVLINDEIFRRESDLLHTNDSFVL